MPIVQKILLMRAMLAVGLLSLAVTFARAVDLPGEKVIGQWKLVSVLDFADMAAMDERQAQRLVGKVLIIGKEEIRFGKRICNDLSFATQWVEPTLYLRSQADASADKLGLPNPVEVVEIGCTMVFIKKPDRIVLHWDGFFFDAVRQHK